MISKQTGNSTVLNWDFLRNLDEINKWAYDNGKYPNSYNIREFYYPDSAKKAFPDNVTADLTKADK